jgi:hypothetical protein
VRLDVLRTGSCRRVRTALLLLQLLQLLHLPIELDSPASDTHEDQRPECVEAAHAGGGSYASPRMWELAWKITWLGARMPPAHRPCST